MIKRLKYMMIGLLSCTAAHAANVVEQGYYVPIGQYYISWAYPKINLSSAQALGLTGKNVVVGVFDTGLNTSNYKFSGNLAGTSYNIYTGSKVTNDLNGHGTFVSSIIAANKLTNGSAMTMYGVASGARLLPVQVLDSAGKGNWTDAQMAAGIKYAAANGSRIFNNSWGSSLQLGQITSAQIYSANSKTIAAYEAAAAKGIVTIFAAGNDGKANPGYWATLPSIDSKLKGTWIVVVAADTNGALASWSNRCGIAKSYCITAPGSNVLGISGNNTAVGSGTSFAAPMVSGGVAILMQQWPYLTGSQISNILLRTANKTGIYANQNVYGQGLMDLYAATKPIGTATIPTGANISSTSIPITHAGLNLPAAFGSIRAAGRDLLVLDDYNRAYSLSVDSMIGKPQSRFNLELQLSRFDSDQPIVDLTSSVKLGIVNDANAVQREKVSTLIPELGNPYLSMGQDQKIVVSVSDVTAWYSTHISSAADDQSMYASNTPQPVVAGALYRIGALQVGVVHEDNSLYGQQVTAGSSMATGANTAFAAADHTWYLGDGYQLDASASIGVSSITGLNELITRTDNVLLASSAVGIGKTGVLYKQDRVGLIASIPNHTITGTASLNTPVSRDFDGNISYESQTVNLTGSGIETDLQAYWTNQIDPHNKVSIAASVRLQPEGDANAAADVIGMMRYSLQF